jgi:hypothetical protein
MCAPFINHGELKEVVDIHQAEDEADRRGHGTPALVVVEMGTGEAKRSPSRFERASVLCQDIADPIRVGSIGQGDGVAIASSEDVDRGAVLTP